MRNLLPRRFSPRLQSVKSRLLVSVRALLLLLRFQLVVQLLFFSVVFEVVLRPQVFLLTKLIKLFLRSAILIKELAFQLQDFL